MHAMTPLWGVGVQHAKRDFKMYNKLNYTAADHHNVYIM
jgi:hypothetical protein